MSAARLRIWLTGAMADQLPPEKVSEICQKFLALAANDAAGEKVYIPSVHEDPRYDEIERLHVAGKSHRQIAETIGVSPSTVRNRLRIIRPTDCADRGG